MQTHESVITAELRTAQENNAVAKQSQLEKQKTEYDYLVNLINSSAKNGRNTTFINFNLEYVDIENIHGQPTTRPTVPSRVLQYKRELENKGYKVTIAVGTESKNVRLDIEW